MSDSFPIPFHVWMIFPLVDLRPVLSPRGSLVVRPWQDRSIENYLRGFGRISYRKNDNTGFPDQGWLRSNESWYFSAAHFARVLPKDPRNASAQLPNGASVRQPIPARLFTDGVLSARLEIVLEVTPPSASTTVQSLLPDISRLSVELRNRQKGRRAPARTIMQLHDLKRYFRISYARARQLSPNLGTEPDVQLVQPLDPLIITVSRSDDPLRIAQGKWLSDVTSRTATFRVLQLDAFEEELATVRALRRTFVRLYALTGAMRQLSNRLDAGEEIVLQDGAAKQLEPLVQQAQDGILSLRERPNRSLAALDASVEGFQHEAEALGNLLVRPGDALLAKRLLGFTQSRARRPVLVTAKLQEVVYTLGITARLFDYRAVLLAALPQEVVASFETDMQPDKQLSFDILNLSRTTGPNGLPYIVPWLRQAAVLLSGDEAAARQLRAFADEAAAQATAGIRADEPVGARVT